MINWPDKKSEKDQDGKLGDERVRRLVSGEEEAGNTVETFLGFGLAQRACACFLPHIAR